MQQVLPIFGGNQMDYAELYLWDIPVVWSKPESGDRELISLRDRTPRIAAEGCDIEALIHSEMGRQMVLQFEDYILKTTSATATKWTRPMCRSGTRRVWTSK